MSLGESGARLAQSAERKALNLVVVGSSPTVGVFLPHIINSPPSFPLLLFAYLGVQCRLGKARVNPWCLRECVLLC